MGDLLSRLWACFDSSEPLFSAREVASWPDGQAQWLQERGVLCATTSASRVGCSCCPSGHVEDVLEVPDADPPRFFIACPESVTSRLIQKPCGNGRSTVTPSLRSSRRRLVFRDVPLRSSLAVCGGSAQPDGSRLPVRCCWPGGSVPMMPPASQPTRVRQVGPLCWSAGRNPHPTSGRAGHRGVSHCRV